MTLPGTCQSHCCDGGLGFGVEGLGFGVQGRGFRVEGLGRVLGFDRYDMCLEEGLCRVSGAHIVVSSAGYWGEVGFGDAMAGLW